jgi:hypothetical protein
MPQKTAFFKPPLLDPQIQQIHFYRKIWIMKNYHISR